MADQRLVQTLQALDAEGLISADPGVVRMLSGHAYDIESGPSVFALPAIVVAPGDGAAILVCSADEAQASDAVVTYEGFTLAPIDRIAAARRALIEAVERGGGAAKRWALDGASLPVAALPPLAHARTLDRLPGSLTAVKTAADIAAIELAVAICDAGQEAARRGGEEEFELDMWARLRAAMEAAAGERLPILADAASGPRTAGAGGPPTPRRIVRGDLILIDLVPRVGGVWGDCCATFTHGEPTAAQRAAHATACAALEAGKRMLRPGVRAGDIDATVREALRAEGFEYPHHTGHGLGFAWHEEPRVVPGSDTILEPGMVVALEPAAYAADWGLRVEQVCVVTDGAPRVLSGHDLGLDAEPR